MGPTLFVIFINPLDLAVEKLSTILSKFADDTKIGLIVNNEEDRKRLQEVIDILLKWAQDWQMTFNSSKCKVLHLGKSNKNYVYSMGTQQLGVTTCEKDIGVLVTNDLKPSPQCAAAATKANQLLGRMARAFSYRDKYTWIKLYKVYIRPHLEYCVQSWSPWLRSDIDLLENVQKRVLRMTSGLLGQTYPEQLKEVDLTTLEDRRVRGDLIQTWKILHHHDNVDESIWFTRISEVSQRETRLSACPMNIALKSSNLDIRKNFFSLRVINKWNSLPEEVKNACSLNSFKNMYDSYMSNV